MWVDGWVWVRRGGWVDREYYLCVVFGAVVVKAFCELFDDHREVPAQPQGA